MKKYNLATIFKKYDIKNIVSDSRKVGVGDAFFALKGKTSDGNKYITDAINSGANLIIKQLDSDKSEDNKFKDKIYYVEDVREALVLAIKLLYPNLPKSLIAVTGTSGKTSVVSYCHQLLSLLSQSSATIGTLGVKCSDLSLESELSKEGSEALNTLDLLSLRKLLFKAADKIDYVSFEASSHGLDQQRLGDLKVNAAAFVSFGHDHLDYHQTKENYLQAKLKLFSEHLDDKGVAIINKDMHNSAEVLEFLADKNIQTITVGKNGDLQIINTEQTLHGQKIEFLYQNKNYQIAVPIIGSYQATNLLISTLLVNQVIDKNIANIEKIFTLLPKLKAVEGRLQKIESESYNIFIDYSHKPDALENALLELKKLKSPDKKLIVVFGCGGNRDTEKRPMMGEIASKIADIVIITDDNSRHEDPKLIRQAIIAGAENATEIGDRYQAIKKAIEILNEGDILLIGGKGHEKYQIIGDKKYDFDDLEIAKQILLIKDK